MHIFSERKIWDIKDVIKFIKVKLQEEPHLTSLWVRGEVSNFKCHSSGHMYLTLKDETAILKTVMFKGYASQLKFMPKNGLKVVVFGYVSVYERDGVMQFYAEHMEPDGVGSLHLAFEKLKEELSQKGYFNPEMKKPIPFLPSKICVITSPTGSVIRDILHVCTRRFPQVQICVYPVAVQGEGAAIQVRDAIFKVNELGMADVIIVARGGGSLEELWPFNQIEVAEGIYHSKIPVISAIGHETDYTICDFVADLRAPTPSAAAELALPEKILLKQKVGTYESKLFLALKNFSQIKREKLTALQHRVPFKQPLNQIHNLQAKLVNLTKHLYQQGEQQKKSAENQLAKLCAKLNALSPLNVLARGYAVVNKEQNNQLIASVKQVLNGEKIVVHVQDGSMQCVVEDVKEVRENETKA